MALSRRRFLSGTLGLPALAATGGLGMAAPVAAAAPAGALSAVTVVHDGAGTLPAGRWLSLGHAFRSGDLPRGTRLAVVGGDGRPVEVQQYDNEAFGHGDGSLSFATIGFACPTPIAAGGTLPLWLCRLPGAKRQPASGMAARLVADRGFVLELWLDDGAPYRSSLAEALAAPTARVIGDGPAYKEWRCLAAFRRDGVRHPDLWSLFYARRHADGTVRLAVRVNNGWMGDGRNYHIRRAVLRDGGGPLAGFARQDFEHLYHSAWFAFDGDGQPYWDHGPPPAVVRVGAGYAAAALAVWPYDPDLARRIGPPEAMHYSQVQPPGYVPRYQPGDKAGYTPYVASPGDPAERGELGPLPSWSVAHLLTGSPAWARYDRIHALALGGAPVSYFEANGEVPVLTNTAYAGLAAPRPQAGWGARGNIVNPPEAGGWRGTDTNTPGGAPRLDFSHWPNGTQSAWLLCGDYWFLDLLLGMAVHAVGVVSPGRRRQQVGATSFDGVVATDNEPRGIAWAMRDLCNAAWTCPEAHPARSYLSDLNGANWGWWKAVLADPARIPPEQKALGWIINDQAVIPMWQSDVLATSILMAYRRGRPAVEAMVDGFVRRWVFGRMGGGSAGGCIHRAFARRAEIRSGRGWRQSWGELGVGDHGGFVPLRPDGGCPAEGLEDGSGVPVQWHKWWAYRSPNSYAALGHMAAACGVIAGIAEASAAYRYLCREDRLTAKAWAACPRYRIRPNDTNGRKC